MCWIHQHLLWKRHIGKLESPCILWVAAVCKNQACTCWVDSWTPFISHAQICFSFYGNMVSFRMVKIVHLHGNCKNGRLCYFLHLPIHQFKHQYTIMFHYFISLFSFRCIYKIKMLFFFQSETNYHQNVSIAAIVGFLCELSLSSPIMQALNISIAFLP